MQPRAVEGASPEGRAPESRAQALSAGPGWLVIVALLGAWLLLMVRTIDRPLQTPDELRVAAISRETARQQQWILPHLNGRPFVDKPPVVFVASGLSERALGPRGLGATGPWTWRVPQVLLALLTLGCGFVIARRLGGAAAGWLTAFFLATSVRFLSSATELLTDAGLMGFLALSALAALLAWQEERRGRALGWWALACVALTLATGSKGPVAVALYGVTGVGLLAAARWRARDLIAPGLIVLPSLLLLVVWGEALQQMGGSTLAGKALIENTWGRFAHASMGHPRPFYYYLLALPVAVLPWTPFVVLGLVEAVQRVRASARSAPSRAVLGGLLGWGVGGVLLLSASSSKRALYLLPVLLPWCVFAGTWLSGWLAREAPEGATPARVDRIGRWCVDGLRVGLGVAALGWAISALGTHPRDALLTAAGAFLLAGPALRGVWNDRRASVAALVAGGAWITLFFAPHLIVSGSTVEPASFAQIHAAAQTGHRLYGVNLSERGRAAVYLAMDHPVEQRTFAEITSGEEMPLSAGDVLVVGIGHLEPTLAALAERGIPARSQPIPLGRRELWLVTLEEAQG